MLFTVTVAVLVTTFLVTLLVRYLVRTRQRASVLAHGQRTQGQLVDIHQTGLMVNGRPEMAMTVRLQEGATTRDVPIKRVVDLGQMPRVGDMIALMMDSRDPEALEYLGVIAPNAPHLTALPIDCAIIGDPRFHVGMVLSTTGGSAPVLQVSLQSVVEPPRKVTVSSGTSDFPYAAGHRVYLTEDTAGGDSFSVVPLAQTGGRPLNVSDAHLDAKVLGPQLLHRGAKGSAVILEARQVSGGPGFMREQGRQRWFLKFRITPEDGSPAWEHADTLTYSSPEKAARICVVGQTVPVRYSAIDRTQMMTDPLAMGMEDPFLLQCQAWNNAVAKGFTDDI